MRPIDLRQDNTAGPTGRRARSPPGSPRCSTGTSGWLNRAPSPNISRTSSPMRPVSCPRTPASAPGPARSWRSCAATSARCGMSALPRRYFTRAGRARRPSDAPRARRQPTSHSRSPASCCTVHANLFGAWCLADTDLAMMLQRLVHNGDPSRRRSPPTPRRNGSARPCARTSSTNGPPSFPTTTQPIRIGKRAVAGRRTGNIQFAFLRARFLGPIARIARAES